MGMEHFSNINNKMTLTLKSDLQTCAIKTLTKR